ncbi:ATP-dependent acyl-CoA ligase [Desulfonema ishimotonii]|uniref:ATP-dependent acyl-CoA ligase n=1 Tax=Desulfonema ishimotonii TaxID=45657 RepID=A0A401FY27_9BACT|nr:AMP-binding protein [Desulfonema ishimotonii]GBC61865.1 ATP-dependent acyl-CoA ligase [Desulfonema ishimotonii]
MTVSRVPGHLARELENKAETMPDFEVVTFENGDYPDEVLTYKDIVQKGRKLAGELRNRGIGKGDVFALVMRNQPEFVYSLYAASALGAVLLPVDPRTKGDRLAYVLRDSKAKGIIFSAEFTANAEEVLGSIPAVKVLGVSYKAGSEVSEPDRYPNLNRILDGPDADRLDRMNDETDIPLEIIYTSGTTGNPKGVVIKGSRMLVFPKIAQYVFQYTADDRLYTGLSLTHGNAQAVTLFPSLLLSIPSVISQKFTKSRIWDICRKYGCTSFSLLGGMMMGIFSETEKPDDTDNPVRLVLSAGTPAPVWEAFERRFGVLIHEWYGAAEGGFCHKPPGVGPVGSFGKPLDGAEVRIVREDDTECEPGEIGELISRVGGQKAEVEYLGKKAASEKKTRGGWLRSGDMCHRDEAGWLFFDFRKGGGLRRAGDFIMPEHVEAVIAKHPAVSDICVYGIPAASGAPGESDIVAALVPMNGDKIDPGSIFSLCREHLGGSAVPSYLQVVDDIPKTVSEKNLSRILKEAFGKDAPNVFRLSEYRS